MNLFITELTYIVPLSKIEEQLTAHRDFLNRYIEENKILVAGKKNPRDGGVIIFRAHNKSEVEQMMANDPFIKFNLATTKIIEVEPTLYSPSMKEIL